VQQERMRAVRDFFIVVDSVVLSSLQYFNTGMHPIKTSSDYPKRDMQAAGHAVQHNLVPVSSQDKLEGLQKW